MTGRPLIEGFAAFWNGDFKKAAEQLYTARYIVNSFGGSHAQRDVIDLTLLEASVRAGNTDMAKALSNERLAAKPESLSNKQLARRAAGSQLMQRRAS